MTLFTPPTLVSGEGAVAIAIGARLRRDGLAVRLLPPGDLTAQALHRAQTLILAAPADPAAAVAGVVRGCADPRSRHSPLRLILAHRGDRPPDLPEPPEAALVRLEPISLEAQGARALLTAHPPHVGFDPQFGQAPHLLVAGRAPPALALLGHAMRLAHHGEARPTFTLAADPPEAWRAEVMAASPKADLCCTLRFDGLKRPDLAGAPPVTSVWVFLDPPKAGLDAALHLAAWLREVQGVAPAIYLEVGGVALLGTIDDWDGQILPIRWLDAAAGALLAGNGDRLARVIHDHYRDTAEAQGRDPAMEPAGRPWELLDASYKAASRHQADHIWAKLADSDCRTVALAEASAFAFAPTEVERLAELEHRRWAADRHLSGWTYAPVRENSLRRHPQLVPYADLNEPMKDLHRYVVRLVPSLLARSGLALVRGLILGVAEAGLGVVPDRPTRRLVSACMHRLRERHPDRALVVATSLADPFTRLVATLALDRFDAVLWLLCSVPMPDFLAAQPDRGARLEVLRLVARAERRIGLAGAAGVAEWFARRAQVVLVPGTNPAPAAPPRQVRLDPGGAGLTWAFEY
jgi:hypothetical protein